jgi:hypothetical protein
MMLSETMVQETMVQEAMVHAMAQAAGRIWKQRLLRMIGVPTGE